PHTTSACYTLSLHDALPILLVDTYEVLVPLDSWIRDVFLPQLPSQALVVLCGRNPPAPGWRADPAWSELTHVMPLRNLQPRDSRSEEDTSELQSLAYLVCRL